MICLYSITIKETGENIKWIRLSLVYAPTRRSIFSAPDAVKYRGLTARRLEELGIRFMDITDVNEEGFFTVTKICIRLRRSSRGKNRRTLSASL